MNRRCDCDLRDRQWNGYGKCLSCGGAYVDDRPKQPMPIKTSGPAIVDLVIADFGERDRVGVETYGARLQAHNGRDSLRDAYEEALDLALYLRQRIEEGGAKAFYTAPVSAVTHDPNVVTYRGGHPSHGVHVGPDALRQAREYAARNGMTVYALVEVKP